MIVQRLKPTTQRVPRLIKPRAQIAVKACGRCGGTAYADYDAHYTCVNCGRAVTA